MGPSLCCDGFGDGYWSGVLDDGDWGWAVGANGLGASVCCDRVDGGDRCRNVCWNDNGMCVFGLLGVD